MHTVALPGGKRHQGDTNPAAAGKAARRGRPATDDTELTLLLSYLDFRKMGAEQSFPASGTVRDNPNGSIGADLFLGYPGLSGYQARNVSLGYGFGHALGDGWTLRQNLRYARSRVGYVSNWAYSGEMEDDRHFRFGLQDRPKDQRDAPRRRQRRGPPLQRAAAAHAPGRSRPCPP
jgi:hypothetical protein